MERMRTRMGVAVTIKDDLKEVKEMISSLLWMTIEIIKFRMRDVTLFTIFF